MNRKFKRIYI